MDHEHGDNFVFDNISVQTDLHSLHVMSQQLKSEDEFLKLCVVDDPLQWVKYPIIEA